MRANFYLLRRALALGRDFFLHFGQKRLIIKKYQTKKTPKMQKKKKIQQNLKKKFNPKRISLKKSKPPKIWKNLEKSNIYIYTFF